MSDPQEPMHHPNMHHHNAPTDCPSPTDPWNCPEPPYSNPDADRCVTCPPLPRETRYQLPGPQVEPEASFWALGPCPPLCTIRIEDLITVTDDPTNPHYFPPYPTDPAVVRDEINELIELASLRDDPEAA